jgi:hypothetical protein
MWPMGGIATKQFRPSAPPAHFNSGSGFRTIQELGGHHELHIALFNIYNRYREDAARLLQQRDEKFYFYEFGVYGRPHGTVCCFVSINDSTYEWIVGGPEQAIEWYNLFTNVLGDPDRFSFLGFGQESSEPTNIEDFQ